jgi:hypothetical protein
MPLGRERSVDRSHANGAKPTLVALSTKRPYGKKRDVDVAVGASRGNWTALAETWERDLSQKLGLVVNVRTLLNSSVQNACDECSILLSE